VCVAYKLDYKAREALAYLGYTERELSIGSVKNKLSNCRYLDLGAVKGSLPHVSREHERVWVEELGFGIHGVRE
jgi:hypothetical protein